MSTRPELTFRIQARGFTLIEMVVVVAIVGILAAAAQPLLALSTRRQQELTLRQNLRQLRDAIDAYKAAVLAEQIESPADGSGYPPSLQVLVEGVPLKAAKAADGAGAAPTMPGATGAAAQQALLAPRRIYFLRRLPRDPLADPALPAAQTWGLRSYDSNPNNPQPGRDVFDVYSRSTGIALDGTPYRDW